MNNIFSKDKKPEAEKKPAAEQKTAFYKRRNFKFGSVATLITVFVIAAIVIVNVLVTFLVVKYPLSVDMTTNQDYKLTADTTKYLKNMSTKIDIYIIDSESGFQNAAYPNTSTYCYKNAYEIIKQYPQYDSNIQVHYIDINTDPSFKSEYPNETLALDDVIVANGTKYKHLTSTDLFTTTTSNYGDMKVSGNTTEQAIDSGILSVTATNLPSIVLTTGHDETGYDGLKALLTSNNYTVVTQDLSLKKLDSKVAVLAIVDPRVDFTTTEISQIDAFLNNNDKYGKSLMVYFDPGQSTLPNLENYLSNYWGLKVGKGTLYDQTHAVNAIQYPIAETLDTTIFSKLSTSIVTMLPNTRPISPLYTTKSNDTTSALMQTYNSTALWVAKSKTDKLAPSASDKKAVY
ncbi:MAG: Gldg family protein, partial [Clostridia bacterium]|nr:Gldg family protein [Clostridia bacterium]